MGGRKTLWCHTSDDFAINRSAVLVEAPGAKSVWAQWNTRRCVSATAVLTLKHEAAPRVMRYASSEA